MEIDKSIRWRYKSNRIIDFAFFDTKLHISTNFAYQMLYNIKGGFYMEYEYKNLKNNKKIRIIPLYMDQMELERLLFQEQLVTEK